MIYLDNNATTPVDPGVKESMIHALDVFGNPSSLHKLGRDARLLIENARQNVARLLHCETEEIVFTSGGTESNNIAILGYISQFSSGHIISSSIEHPSVLMPLERIRKMGFDVTHMPVSRNGITDIDALSAAVRKDTRLITVMHANNETGVIQPIREVSQIAKTHDIRVHTDAAQTVGKIKVNVDNLDVDMLTVAGHKFYGPKGIGALYIKQGVQVNPVILGASQERGISPGTENVTGVAGIGAASIIAYDTIDDQLEYIQKLRDALLKGIQEEINHVRINGDLKTCLPNTLNISIEGVVANDLLNALQHEVAFSSGSACHSGSHKPSHVLTRMGINFQDAISAVRLSLGKFNTEADIKEAIRLLSSAVRKLRR